VLNAPNKSSMSPAFGFSFGLSFVFRRTFT